MAIANRNTKGKPSDRKAAPAATAKSAEALITVNTTILENGTIKGEPVEQTTREVKQFATNPAHVSLTLGYNKNLGNIEMAKISVMVSMPCYVEEVDNAFAQVQDKAKQCLDAAIAELGIAGEEAVGGEDTSGAEAETGGEAAEGDGEVNAEWVDNATREELVALIEGNAESLGEVDPETYTDDDDLKEVIKSVLFGEEGTTEAEDEKPYTQETLDAATTDELKQVWEAWSLGKWPVGPEKVARKVAIKKILETEEAGGQ